MHPRFRTLISVIGCSIACCGCSLTYPLMSRDTKPLVGQQLTVQNSAHLLSTDDSKQYEIVVGPILGNQHKVAELPEGTDIQVRSLWRHHRWYLIGGFAPYQVTTDYAWVTATPPDNVSINAKLALAEFEDVFDGSKYRPKPAEP